MLLLLLSLFTGLEYFEDGSMKSKIGFLLVSFSVRREEAFLLIVPDKCFGVSLFEGMLSFISFLYSIS